MKKSRSSNSKKSASTRGKKSSAKKASAFSKRSSGKTPTVARKKSATSKRTASKGAATSKSKSTKARSSKKSVSKSRTSSPVRSSKTKKAQSNNRKAKQLTSAEGLDRVFKDCLKDIYYAEKQLVKALKKMSKASTNVELNEAFDIHMHETVGHVEKLEEIFELLEMRAQGKKCPAMDGLIEEANEQIQEFAKGSALDAALIVCAQKVEHYEIAAYGSLRTFAATLHRDGAWELFEEILEEESNTDKKLTLISQIVNSEAYPEDEEGEDADEEMNEEDEIDEDGNDIIGIEIINVEYGDSDNNQENSDNNGLL